MNMTTRRIPELLAPAGNLEILKMAVDAGADAVYFGGKAFNARQSAANFDADEIREAVEYCYPRGAKTYLTLNTLVKESEWDELCRFADEVLPLGVTGLIMQDLGAAGYVKQRFPQVELHASTQMSVHNAEGAAWLKDLGFCRVVLSRELPLAEVENIVKNVGVETEIFIHGALCYSYSGQCLMSSLIGGRSGNRGRCAQPCRLQYGLSNDPTKRHYLNLKDICTLSEVKALAESGAASLKIEGRLKGAPYVAGVTRAYRRALDYYLATGKNYEPSKEEMEELLLLFNRGGFSKGYVFGKTPDMICQESPKHSGINAGFVRELGPKQMTLTINTKVEPGDTLEIRTRSLPYPSFIVKEKGLSGSRLSMSPIPGVKKGDEVRLLVHQRLGKEILAQLHKRYVPMEVQVQLKKDNYPILIGRTGEKKVRIVGKDKVAQAQTRPLTQEEVIRQMKKTGSSYFQATMVDVDMDNDIFMPVSALNALRRDLTDALTSETQAPYYQAVEVSKDSNEIRQKEDPVLEAVVTTLEQAQAAIGKVRRVYLREEFFKPEQMGQLKKMTKGTDTELCLALPHITREKASQRIFSELKLWADQGIRRVLVQHLGQIKPVQEQGLAVEAGIGIPVMNEACRQFFHGNLVGYTASVELNAKELKELNYDPACACVVYGRIPVMLTEQCPAKENGSCRKGQDLQLVDRMNEVWPMERHCLDCYNVFYSNKPIWIANRTRLLRDLPAGKWRMYFLEEDADQTAEIIHQYQLAMAGEEAVAKPKSYMSGHYDKGVE